jgi:hypothetical protein
VIVRKLVVGREAPLCQLLAEGEHVAERLGGVVGEPFTLRQVVDA